MKLFYKWWIAIQETVEESKYQFIPFGIIGIIGYIAYYFIWHATINTYESPALRTIAIMLLLGLISSRFWSDKFKKIIPFYWYFTVIYTLPFFFTFMLLKNHESAVWVQNIMVAIIFGILLFNFIELIITFTIGVVAAYFFYLITTSSTPIPESFFTIGISYFSVLPAVILLAYTRNQKLKAKFATLKLISASIAHELRTPLRAIDAGASGLQKYLPPLLAGYDAAKQHNLEIPKLPQNTLQNLNAVLGNINSEVQAAFTVISMLLVNANEADIGKNYQLCSVNACVDTALARYPFMPDERGLIAWRPSADFLFRGNEQLMIHILFNLFKNGLYFVKAADKGSITIWSEHTADWHYLQFKDTGQGISKSDLTHIFDRFFSRTRHGTGIGLAFCKIAMKSFGGDMLCESIEGEYTLFTMKFPRIE